MFVIWPSLFSSLPCLTVQPQQLSLCPTFLGVMYLCICFVFQCTSVLLHQLEMLFIVPHPSVCLLNSCSQGCGLHGQWQMFQYLCAHGYWNAPGFTLYVFVCLPVSLRSALCCWRVGPVHCRLYTGAQPFVRVWQGVGKEGAVSQKWNGWPYTMAGDIKKLKEQLQSMSCNSSELCVRLLCAVELCPVANDFWKSHSPNA